MYVIEVALLVGLTFVLIELERPLICASIYGAVVLLSATIGLASGAIGWVNYVVQVPLSIGAAVLYFWLLDRFEQLSMPWWITLMVGIFTLVFVV